MNNYINVDGGLYTKIEEWYISNGFTNSDFISKIKLDKWCLGGSEEHKYDTTTGDLITGSTSYYEWYTSAGNRIYNNETTSLMCENEEYVLSGFGSITVDELMLAGSSFADENFGHYLYQNAQNRSYWTLSIGFFDDVVIYTVFYANDNGSVKSASAPDFQQYARPAITLIPGITITGGVGTKTSPYIISAS